MLINLTKTTEQFCSVVVFIVFNDKFTFFDTFS